MSKSKYLLRPMFAGPTAAVGGISYFLALPATNYWFLAPLGVLLLALAIWGQKVKHGLWIGAVFGVTFWLPLINWLSLYLGPIPWLALSFLMVVWFSLFGGIASYTTAKLNPFLGSLSFAGLWVTREAIQSNFPYDGFAWGRLVHTIAEGPFINMVAWLGFAGTSGLLALVAVLPLTLFLLYMRSIKKTLVAVSGFFILVLLLMLTPVPQSKTVGTLSIVAVQGNSKSGVFDDRENGDVIADHIKATNEWLAENDNNKNVDVFVWPENSAEFNLLANQNNFSAVKDLVNKTGASFLVGSIIRDDEADGSRFTNSSLVLQPESNRVLRYDKKHPVPFAEYMPHRAFYRALVPNLVDLVQLEYEHGSTQSVLPITGKNAGIAICFDIIFDDHAALMQAENAQVIFAQTNNADFGLTDQSEQQTAIAKLRAVEMGKPLVNISTVATSKIFAADGETLAAVPQWQRGSMHADVELKEGTTPAMLLGSFFSSLWIFIGVALTFVAIVTNRKVKQQGNVKKSS